MSTLIGKDIEDTIGDLLQVSNSNSGIDSTLRNIEDGFGTQGALQISTTGIKATGTMFYGTSSIAFGGNFSTGSTFSTTGAFSFSGAYSFAGTLTANTTLTFPTVGTLSTLTGTETLTNKTLTTPKIAQINDTNGNTSVTYTAMTSAVNYSNWTNAATSGLPKLSFLGSDSAVSGEISVKGAGSLYISATGAQGSLGFREDPSNGTNNILLRAPAALGADYILDLPAVTDTLVAKTTTDTLTNKTLVAPVLGVATATSINFGGGALSTYVPWTNYTPTVTSSVGGDTIPVYSTNSGRYTRIGNVVHVDINLTGDGGAEGSGSGNLRIALPISIGASIGNNIIPCGRFFNSGTFGLLITSLTAGAAYAEFAYFNAISTTAAFTPTLQNNTTRAINVSFRYEV